MNNFGNRKFTESLIQNLCPGRGIAFRDERLLFGGGQQSAAFIRCQPGTVVGLCVCVCTCV